jgi:hypothetical protein
MAQYSNEGTTQRFERGIIPSCRHPLHAGTITR